MNTRPDEPTKEPTRILIWPSLQLGPAQRIGTSKKRLGIYMDDPNARTYEYNRYWRRRWMKEFKSGALS